MNIIHGLSLIAWQHVNLFGKFEFSPTMSQVDIIGLAACYDDPVCWSKILKEHTEDVLKG